MSSGGQIVGGVVGAVVGFYVGGPMGALQGAALGAGVGAALDPPKGPTVEGPRLSDLSIQTSTYGAFLPRVYGTVGISGNIIWLENNKLKETMRKEEQGGKGGGGSTTVKIYSYSATFALALCEGEIDAVRRIWCSDKLIYNNSSSNLDTIIASNRSARGWRLYRGTDNQLPDPRYQANVGVGNASAFRGIAYLVFYDFQLADYGNTLQGAQFKVEIIKNRQLETVNVVMSVTPNNVPPLTQIAGVAFDSSLENFKYTTSSTFSSLTVASLKYGKSYDRVDYINAVEKLNNWESAISYDGRAWGQYNSNRLSNDKIAVADDGRYIANTQGVGSMQWFWNVGEHYRMMISPAISPSALSSFAKAYVNDDNIYGVTTDIVPVSSGFFGSTAGTSPFEIRFVSGSLNYNVLDENFSQIQSYSVLLGTGYYPDITGTSGINGSIHPYYLNGVLYIAYKNSDTNIRITCIRNGVKYLEYNVAISSMIGGMSGLVMLNDYQGAIAGRRFIQWAVPFGSTVPLAEVVQTECNLSSLISTADLDTSLLTSTVRGFHVSGGTIRSAIEPLQAAYPFDVVPSGYDIRFIPRGQNSVRTIPWQDLGASTGEAVAMLADSREMDSQLPAKTNIKYMDASREYAISEQYAERLNTAAVNRVDRELPLVLNADEAAGVAEVLTFLPWLERNEYSITLPPIHGDLEPADVVTIEDKDGSLFEVRFAAVKTGADGVLSLNARPNRAALYAPDASGTEGVPPDGTVDLDGDSTLVVLDIPVINETIQNAVGFVSAVCGDSTSWPGATMFRSSDEGQTWSDIQGFQGSSTIGSARNTLPSSPCTQIDQRTLTVELRSGQLESITRDQMLTGANFAAYGADGRWEIVRFQTASLGSDGNYTVSGFVRGDKGTEWASGLHQDGDWFILLDDPDNAFISMAVEAIGVDRTYRAVTSGQSIDDADSVLFAYKGVNLECLSAVYARGSRDGSNNFTGTFTRRSRLSSSWWTNGVEAPVGETSESYQIDVMNGSTVVRTISVTSPSFTYSSANQISDFGSAQSSITFRIYQLSAVVGRGYVYEVTL